MNRLTAEIVAADGGRAFRDFLEFPYKLYRGDPYWVPPLRIAVKEMFDRKKHPFYANAEVACFAARRNGEVRGRIAAIHDRAYNAFQQEEAGHFGFFECREEPETAKALLGAAREWLAARGAKVFRGPFSPSTNYECGLLVEGFDSAPWVMMPYNPPYYATLLEGAGLHKAKDLYAYYGRTREVVRERIDRVAQAAMKKQGLRIRPIRMKHFAEELEQVWKVYNSAWSRNWGFVPMSREEFFHMGKDMKTILDPEMVLLGEVGGRVVGFALALPDINRALKHADGKILPLGLFKILYHKRSIHSVRVLVLGVVPEHRTAGVAAGFYYELFRRGLRLGYEDGEMSWILEDNTLMNRSIEAFGGKKYKTYRIYEWN
jgi:hypothetical protein